VLLNETGQYVCCRTDRYYDSHYGTSIVAAFIIEKHGEIKEKFSYEIPFNKTTRQSLVAYSRANYGSDAVFRNMTDAEKADFIAPAQDSTWGNRMVKLAARLGISNTLLGHYRLDRHLD
jgi:hypothetical protein